MSALNTRRYLYPFVWITHTGRTGSAGGLRDTGWAIVVAPQKSLKCLSGQSSKVLLKENSRRKYQTLALTERTPVYKYKRN